MGREVGDRTRADGRRVQVAGASHDRCAGQQAELGGGGGGQSPEHAPGRHELGQGGAFESSQLDERVVVRDGVPIAVVGHPVDGDGVVRGRGPAR